MSENLNKSIEEKPKLSLYFVKFENENGFIEIDENIKPTEILDYPYLYHVNKETENTFPYLIPYKRGKWMMFIKNEDFDQKWKDCCKLYDENKLTGIRYLTCSTGYRLKDTTYSGITAGAIFFHCGPASEKDKMLEYGKNLLKYIPYWVDYGYMPYKSREQTEKNTQLITYKSWGKTEKNIQSTDYSCYSNFLYRIPVPTYEAFEGKLDGNRFFVRSEDNLDSPRIEVDKDVKPTEIQEYFYLYHQNINVLNLFSDLDPKLMGKWMMFFKDMEDFDEKWKLGCKLYQEGKLIGIRSLKCSTGYKNPAHPVNVIFFYCGPASDRDKMLEYGKNLLQFIPYCDDYGHMTYKSILLHYSEQTEKNKQSIAYKSWENTEKDMQSTDYSCSNFSYGIPVPTHEAFEGKLDGNRFFDSAP